MKKNFSYLQRATSKMAKPLFLRKSELDSKSNTVSNTMPNTMSNIMPSTMLLVSSAYILGLVSFISEKEILFAAVAFVILTGLILKDKVSAAFALLLYFFLMIGILNAHFQIKDGDVLSHIGFSNNALIEGRVTSIPQVSLNGTRLRFNVDTEKTSVYSRVYENTASKTLVTLNDDNAAFKDIKIGDYVRLNGKLRKPAPARNPSQFDYGRYLRFQNIFTTFYAKNDFEILSSPTFKEQPWWWTLRSLDIKRGEIIAKHSKYIKSPYLEILGGIVFGDEAVNPPDDIKQSFINSGLLHLLAASGLNVGLIFGLWWFAAVKMRLPYRVSIISGMFCVILYTFMTGFPPSILRASVMILIVLMGKLWHKEANSLALVFLVALMLLIVEPEMIVNVGFQLSFLVTIGLLICTEPIGEKFEEWDKNFKAKHKERHPFFRKMLDFVSPKYLAMAFAVPLVAQIWVAPLQMHYFNTFTPYSVFANIAVLPFVGIISFLGFLSSVIAPIPFDFIIQTFDFFINPLAVALLAVSSFFASLPHSILTVPSPSMFSMILYYLLVIFFIHIFSKNFKNRRQNVIFSLLLLAFALSFLRFEGKNFEIIAYDVGNADSFLLKTRRNKYLMIDTAKLPYKGKSAANYIMLEHLKDKNVRELELLIVTHFDNDHSGGVVDILNSLRVKKVIITDENYSTQNSNNIMKTLKDLKVNYKIVKNGETVYKEPNFSVQTYSAELAHSNSKHVPKSGNDSSIATLVKSTDKSILFMGDAGSDAFETLKDSLPRDIDILKVGHHGAKGSLSLGMLEYLNPKIAIISTGYNTYGHPDYSTLKLLEDKNVETLSTKYLGAIKIVEDKEDFKRYYFPRKRFEELRLNTAGKFTD